MKIFVSPTDSLPTSKWSRGTSRKRTSGDPILVGSLVVGLLATSLTSDSSQNDFYRLPGWMLALQPIARPGAIALLMITLFRYLQLAGPPSFRFFSGPAFWAWLITLFFLLKTLALSGDSSFFSQAFLLALLQMTLLLLYVGKEQVNRIQGSDGSFEHFNFEIAVFLFAAIFVSINLVLMIYSSQAVSTFTGRFFGITANPQHTMMISVLCIPACILFLRSKRQKNYKKAIAIGIMIGLGMIIYMTGSRTGFVVGLAALGFCFLDKLQVSRFATTVLGVSTVLLLVSFVGGSDFWALIQNSIEAQYIDGRRDTRTHVIINELNEFLDNWMIGVPLGDDGRLSFAENYWLSVLSNGGIIAGSMAVALFLMTLHTAVHLLIRGLRRGGQVRHLTNASACFSILLLSLAESVLAGIFAAYTILASGYLAMAWNSISSQYTTKVIEPVRSPR